MRKGIRSVKRSLAVLLSASMIFGMTPIQAGAEETESQNTISGNTVQTEGIENLKRGNEENTQKISNIMTVTGFVPLDESVTNQTLTIGASEGEIAFPDTMTVTMRGQTDSETTNSEADKDNADITESKEAMENAEISAELSGITWKLDEAESDGAAFDSSEAADGYCYVYTPVLPETDADGNSIQVADGVELPIIYVLIEEQQLMTLATEAGHYDDNGFCTGYELKNDGTWGKKADDACTEETCNGYQPAVLTTTQHDIDGDGNTDNVYEISNAGQLYWFAALVNGTLTGVEQDTSANGFLTENITVNRNVLDESGALVNDTSTFRKWIPIGGYYNEDIVCYAGKFDGNSKTISGLYDSDSSNMDTGIFGVIGENSKLSDVGIVDSYFNAMATAGGICGNNQGTIENCYSSSSVTAAYAGGVCGSNMGEILKCYNTGNVANGTYSIDNYSYAGGICGSNDGTGGKVESSYNSGNINGTGYIGGVCGANGIYFKTIITNCYNIGIVSGSGEDTGGVCGFNGGYTANSYNAGTVSGTGKYIGSVCGLNNSIVTTCYSLKADDSLSEVGEKGASATAYKVQTKNAEQFSNGEIAYLLNGSDDTFTWRQSLDFDKLPVLDETHAKVYASAPCHANFSNSKEKLSTLEHRFKDGVCEVCGEPDVPEQINGVYQLGTENNLYWFAEQVNSGKTSLNAVLTKNITVNTEELSEASSNAKSWIPIGNINAMYTGTFNGNGYTISGLYCNDNFNGPIGLFGYIEDKGCVSNVGLEKGAKLAVSVV